MKNPIFLSVIMTLLLTLQVFGQDKLSWKKHVKLADELSAKAQYADAGEHYRAAWKQKTKNKDLAYKAGLCFYTIRDYRNAADAWKNVKNGLESDPLVGLRYARCLKQNGEYEAASSELVNFLGSYQGQDKATVSQLVQGELRGCELAAQQHIKGDDKNIVLEHLGSNINTPETEFAPIAFSDEALYFSSTMAKRAEIYRSIKSGNEWGKATPIENFPAIEKDHFCNGALTPDASRFYFTICQSEETWGGLTTHCEIYLTRRVGKTWTTPERLPDYINEKNITTTHPCVIVDGDTEILYFSSNRNGGLGGMDVWYATREVSSTANDFTLPINAGSRINTIGDEITPYYDKMAGELYFASNGQVSIGGLDIFRVKGAKSQWQNAENVGTPLNSPADDFFFVKNTSGKGGFVVSNRIFGMEKVTSTNEDIFSFEYSNPVVQFVARGEVYSKESREMLEDVEVALYELGEAGQRKFVSKVVSGNGIYDFAVQPSQKYYLEAVKDGFLTTNYEFDTYEYNSFTDFGAPLYMEPYSKDEPISAAKDEVKKINVKESNGSSTKPSSKPSTTKPAAGTVSSSDKMVVKTTDKNKENNSSETSEAPTSEGTYYKIQIIALGKVDMSHPRFKQVKDLRRLDKEFYADKKLYRVLLADYSSIEEAQADLGNVRSQKEFSDAFIVEYKDGQRIGTIEH